MTKYAKMSAIVWYRKQIDGSVSKNRICAIGFALVLSYLSACHPGKDKREEQEPTTSRTWTM